MEDEYINDLGKMYDDLKKLNEFYEKDYITLEDFCNIRDSIIYKIIKTSEYERETINDHPIKKYD